MSKFADALRQHKIYNVHGLIEAFGDEQSVAVCYRPSERIHAAKSYVYSPRHKTDPDSAWYDGGNKSFNGKRTISMPKALAWAGEKYGVEKWLPYEGSMVPKAVIDKAKRFLREAAIRTDSALAKNE